MEGFSLPSSIAVQNIISLCLQTWSDDMMDELVCFEHIQASRAACTETSGSLSDLTTEAHFADNLSQKTEARNYFTAAKTYITEIYQPVRK